MPDNPAHESPNGKRKDKRTPRGISPIMPGRAGRPSYSLEALRELVERQFNAETEGRSDILRALDSEAKRREFLGEIADYVLAGEAVSLAPADRKRLISRAYANLFSFGPLDDLLRDEQVTEIAVNGPYDVHTRRGMGALVPLDTTFDDVHHLERTLERVLAESGITLETPFLETGIILHGRPARLSVIGPPVRTDYSLSLRLHPADPLTLATLQERFGALDAAAADVLRAILRAGHELLIAGDAGLGKTTLAGALVAELAALTGEETRIGAAERAAELHLPPHATRYTPDAGEPFAETLRAALDARPAWLVADEVRSEDAAAVWDALTRDAAPRYLWVFRGTRQPDRLKSALSMTIRQHMPALPQLDINHALAERLPFVVALRRAGESARLAYIAEWALDPGDPAALNLRPLLEYASDGWTRTGSRPEHALDLPDSFWM